MARVLIGFAEALPAPEVVFSLLAAGHEVAAYARTDAIPLGRLPLAALHVVPAPEQDAAGAATALKRLAEDADVILALDDAGLWLTHSTLPGDARIAGAGEVAAVAALDKVIQIEAARAAGLAVPETTVWDGTPGTTPDVPAFPVIAKPGLALKEVDGRLPKGDAHYMAESSGLEPVFGSDRTADAPWLIQPLIRGRGEGVFGFATDTGEVTSWSGHRRVRMMNPHGSGASACESLMPDADLREKVTAFVTALNWRGPFMVELLRGMDGTAWFMELNGRMWGSMALARRQGFEYPAWAVAQVLGPGFTPTGGTHRPMIVRNLGREILHLAFTARGTKSAFHRRDWPSLITSLPAVLRPGRGPGFYN